MHHLTLNDISMGKKNYEFCSAIVLNCIFILYMFAWWQINLQYDTI